MQQEPGVQAEGAGSPGSPVGALHFFFPPWVLVVGLADLVCSGAEGSERPLEELAGLFWDCGVPEDSLLSPGFSGQSLSCQVTWLDWQGVLRRGTLGPSSTAGGRASSVASPASPEILIASAQPGLRTFRSAAGVPGSLCLLSVFWTESKIMPGENFAHMKTFFPVHLSVPLRFHSSEK